MIPVSYTHLDVYKRQLLVCCGSALTVFILLSTSALPALHAIGLTVSLGVVASFVAALTLARPLLTRMS